MAEKIDWETTDRVPTPAQERVILREERHKRRKREAALKASVSRALASNAHRRPTPKKPPTVRVAEVAEAFFGASIEVIKHRLEEGHTQTALDVFNRYCDAVGRKVENPIKLPENATAQEAGMAVVRATMEGQIDVDKGRKLLQMICDMASLDVSKELEELREMLVSLGSANGAIDSDGVSPAWLRLQAAAPPRKTPQNGGNGHDPH